MDLFWVSNRVPKTRPQFTVPVHVEEASTTEELETSFFSLKKTSPGTAHGSDPAAGSG